MSITEKREKKILSQLKGDNRTGLKIVIGPDKRMRLVLDKSAHCKTYMDGDRQIFISSTYLAKNEAELCANGGMPDARGDDFEL